MDAEMKEGMVLVHKALLLSCELQRVLIDEQAKTNELLERNNQLLNEIKPTKWLGGPR